MTYRNINRTNDNSAYKQNMRQHSYAKQRINPMLTLSNSQRKSETDFTTAFRRETPKPGSRKIDPARRTSRLSHARPVRITRKDTALSRKTSTVKRPVIKAGPTQERAAKDGVLRIIPLGGCEEVGRNMTIFEYFTKGNEKNKDIIILDMGLQFPEEDMPGIDYVIPNIEYLKGWGKNIRAVVFSHGHLDHIGAAPILLEKLGNPLIIGRDLTIEMIKHRVEDYKKGTSRNLKTQYIKSLNDTFKFGQMGLKFFAVEHSIKDAVGMILETPAGTVIHPGDWTMEDDPQGRPMVDYTHLANLKTPTILIDRKSVV